VIIVMVVEVMAVVMMVMVAIYKNADEKMVSSVGNILHSENNYCTQ